MRPQWPQQQIKNPAHTGNPAQGSPESYLERLPLLPEILPDLFILQQSANPLPNRSPPKAEEPAKTSPQDKAYEIRLRFKPKHPSIYTGKAVEAPVSIGEREETGDHAA